MARWEQAARGGAEAAFYYGLEAPIDASADFASFTFPQNSGSFLAGGLVTAGAQNDYWTYAERQLLAGTYDLTLLHTTGNSRGIYTIQASDDGGVTWQTLATIDAYAASGAVTRTVVTGIALASGSWRVRITMASKNAASTGYGGSVSGLMLSRVSA